MLRLMLVAACCSGLMASCADKKSDASESGAAARVNKEVISVHQINLALHKQRASKAELTETAGRRALERLVDLELMAQRAEELGLDRDPRVAQQVEAARREAVARLFTDKIESSAGKPTEDDVRAYYFDNPNLFRNRRIYSIQEIEIDAEPDKLEALRAMLSGAQSIWRFMELLKADGLKFTGTQYVRPAEQLPASILSNVAKMKDGQALLLPSTGGAQVIVLIGSKAEPVGEQLARPAIEQFLFIEEKRRLVDAQVKVLRAEGRIEYVGKFAKGPVPEAGMSGASRPAVIFDGLAVDGVANAPAKGR